MRIPATNSYVGVLVIFLFLFLTVGCAEAATPRVSVYNTYIRIYDTNYSTHDIQWLESTVNNSSLVTHSGTTWYVNRSLTTYQTASFRIGNDTANITKLVLGSNADGSKCAITYANFINISNIEIEGGGEVGSRNEFHDVYRHDGSRIRLDTIKTDVYNVTIVNTTTNGVYFSDSNNISIYNITVNNATGTGVHIEKCNNTEIYNIRSENIGNVSRGFYLEKATGKYAFVMTGCKDSIAHDVYGNNTAWSCLEITSPDKEHLSDNITWYNMTAGYSGHNCFDLHSGKNAYLDNITAHDCIPVTGNNILVAGVWNMRLKNVYSYNSNNGYGIAIGALADNITIENYTSYNDAQPLSTKDTDGYKIINMTSISPVGDSLILTLDSFFLPSLNGTLIDLNLGSPTNKDDINIANAPNTTIINAKYDTLRYSVAYNYSSTFYYYLDLVAVYRNGTKINNATVSISNDTFSSKDANGDNKTEFTLPDGRTVSHDVNRVSSPAIPQKYKALNNSTMETTTVSSINNTLTISNGLKNVTLDNLTPDVRWYRQNNSNYTVVALFNDSTDLHLIGYAPSPAYNSYKSGDSVKFQVWGSKPLTNVIWEVDGVEKQNNTSTIYESIVGDVPVTVDITGTDGTETVSKSWIIDPDQVVTDPDPEPDPIPDPENPTYPPVANFTTDKINGTVPLKIQFNDTSINATKWYWDFDNNGKTDSTSQNVSFRYRTPGSYTIKLTVSNSDGMNVTTKTNYIVAEKQSWYIIIWNWFGFGCTGGAMIG